MRNAVRLPLHCGFCLTRIPDAQMSGARVSPVAGACTTTSYGSTFSGVSLPDTFRGWLATGASFGDLPTSSLHTGAGHSGVLLVLQVIFMYALYAALTAACAQTSSHNRLRGLDM